MCAAVKLDHETRHMDPRPRRPMEDRVTVRFVNRGTRAVTLHWVNYAGVDAVDGDQHQVGERDTMSAILALASQIALTAPDADRG